MYWWLAQNALVAGLLAGLVALICWLGRLGPAARHALWLIVLVKLVTPPCVAWPWALPGVNEAAPNQRGAAADAVSSGEESLPLTVEREVIVLFDDPRVGEASPDLLLREVARDEEPSRSNTGDGVPWMHREWLVPLIQALWLAGTVIACLMQFVSIVRFQRLMARASPAPLWLDQLVADVAGRLGVRRPLTLVVPGIGSPFVWSLGRPRLLWPASLLERLSLDCQRSIAVHELAHLRRRDHWVGWIQLVAECLWWWNPLFWYVRRQLRLNAELACDAWVVSTLPEHRRVYAEALIEVTQLLSQTAAPLPALGMSSAARHAFERRLTMIMRDRVPCRVPLLGLLALGVLALLSLPGWSQPDVIIRSIPVQGVPDAKEVPAPEKRDIILGIQADVEWQDVKRALNLVQKTPVDKQVDVEVELKMDAAPDRDRRLEKLEGQLQELLREVQALRGVRPTPKTVIKLAPDKKPGEPSDRPRVEIIERKHLDSKPNPAAKAPDALNADPKSGQLFWGHRTRDADKVTGTVRTRRDGKETVSEVNLSRATYKLPQAEAEALAGLLLHHSRKLEVLEATVTGDSLVVTTTPEALGAITQFVSFLQGATAARSKDGKTGSVIELWQAKPDKEVKEFHYELELDRAPMEGERKDP